MSPKHRDDSEPPVGRELQPHTPAAPQSLMRRQLRRFQDWRFAGLITLCLLGGGWWLWNRMEPDSGMTGVASAPVVTIQGSIPMDFPLQVSAAYDSFSKSCTHAAPLFHPTMSGRLRDELANGATVENNVFDYSVTVPSQLLYRGCLWGLMRVTFSKGDAKGTPVAVLSPYCSDSKPCISEPVTMQCRDEGGSQGIICGHAGYDRKKVSSLYRPYDLGFAATPYDDASLTLHIEKKK